MPTNQTGSEPISYKDIKKYLSAIIPQKNIFSGVPQAFSSGGISGAYGEFIGSMTRPVMESFKAGLPILMGPQYRQTELTKEAQPQNTTQKTQETIGGNRGVMPLVGRNPYIDYSTILRNERTQPAYQNVTQPQATEQSVAPSKMTADQYRAITQDPNATASQKAEAWKNLGITSGGRAVTPGQLLPSDPTQQFLIRESMAPIKTGALAQQDEMNYQMYKTLAPVVNPQPVSRYEVAYQNARDNLSAYVNSVNMAPQLTKQERKKMIEGAINRANSELKNIKQEEMVLSEAEKERKNKRDIAKIGADAQTAIAKSQSEQELNRAYGIAAQQFLENDASARKSQAIISSNAKLEEYKAANEMKVKQMDLLFKMIETMSSGSESKTKAAISALTLWSQSSDKERELLMSSGFNPIESAKVISSGSITSPQLVSLYNAFMSGLNVQTSK